MQLRDLFDPYYIVRKLSFSESPILVKFFGLRAELANYGAPIHNQIFQEVEAWRRGWLYRTDTVIDEHLRLASFALAAGRCRDRVLQQQLGPRRLTLERGFFTGALLLTVAQVAVNSCMHLLAWGRRPAPIQDAICFAANRTTRATVARIFPNGGVHHLDHYGYFINWGAFRFSLSTLWKAPRLFANPRLLSSFIRLLAQYCYVAEHYQPRVIIGFFDSTPSISLLTAYLRQRGIAHYNIMHGEIFFSCDHSSYVEVDRFYIWGRYYRDILLRQHCPDGQYTILASPVLTDLYEKCQQQNQPRDKLLLLLHEPFIEQNEAVFANMLRLLCSIDLTWSVSVRPHPAYTGNLQSFLARIRGMLPEPLKLLRFTIENPHKATPPETLSRHRIVASCVSTMLLEGWLAGCKLVYFSGVMDNSFIVERYQGSPNVLIISPASPAEEVCNFINTPAKLDETETERINHVVQVRN